MKFSHAFLVDSEDIDEHDHVNNVTYLRWIQEVAVAHWKDAAPFEMQKQFTWFVLRHEIDYKNRAFGKDEITATTWVGNASKIKCERFTEIRRGPKILAEAKRVWCLLERESGRPSRISDELRGIFGMR